MTDRQLYRLCKKYGRRALEARRRFSGLLPEVQKRRLYERKGFTSIYEFAAKLAGLTRDNVDMILHLERRFEDKPALHEALVHGEISPHKLSRIASVANTDNERDLLDMAGKLSRRAIDIFVKDYRITAGNSTPISKNGTEIAHQNGLFESENNPKSLSGQRTMPSTEDIRILDALSPEVKNMMKEMMEKGLNLNDELLEFFKQRKVALETEKNEDKRKNRPNQTRYIPAKTKKLLRKEYGIKCAKAGCKRPAEQIHHIRRFALTKDNSPQNLEPLCAGHHELEHGHDPYFQRYRGG